MIPTAETPPPNDRPRALAVVPARLASTRLPRKMLLAETGACLFVHTAENAARSGAFVEVLVAADSDEVLEAAQAAGLSCVSTDPECPSGTDRVFEALQSTDTEYDVVVGVQGDEPELNPRDLDRLVGCFTDAEVEVATLAAPLLDEAAREASSVVKVILDRNSDALYFSRAPLPDLSHARSDADDTLGLRHVGVYAWRPSALARFRALEPSPAERAENLEQLRWLESGGRMRVLVTDRAPHGIDTPEDYAAFVERCRTSGSDVSPDAPHPQRAST